MQELNYPSVDTYYIFFNTNGQEPCHYGLATPQNTVTSGLSTLETFTDKSAFETRLLDFGITYEEEE